jgi:electron transfer flavoprotein beta subunit
MRSRSHTFTMHSENEESDSAKVQMGSSRDKGYQMIVCGSVVAYPLQKLELENGFSSPVVKKKTMRPSTLDSWSTHALYEAAHLADKFPGSDVIFIAFAPKAKLQQVVMTVAQKVPFELIAIDGSAGKFTDATDVAAALADTIQNIPYLDSSRLLVFGGWHSAICGAEATLQLVGEYLGIIDQFHGVTELTISQDGSLLVLERVEGGKQQYSSCAGPPAVLGWVAGNTRIPVNDPRLGMSNMQSFLPAIQQAVPVSLGVDKEALDTVELPDQQRETRIVEDACIDEIAGEIVDWIRGS